MTLLSRADNLRRRTPATITVVLVTLLVWPFLPGVPYDLLNTAVLAWCGCTGENRGHGPRAVRYSTHCPRRT